MLYDTAHQLAREIRESEEYREYEALKKEVMGDETQAALIREYKKLQISIQMANLQGQTPGAEDMQRFSALNTLLFSKPEVSQYIMAEVRMHMAMSDILKIVMEAADLEMNLPGIG